jgi:hypothetical protein
MAFTSLPLGGIFSVQGVTNSFGDYTEFGIYPIADWAKFCDGSQIVDPDSPMNGQYVPNLVGVVPVGNSIAGTEIPARKVGGGIYAFGEWNLPQTISNTEKTLTTKFYMRIK